MNNPIGVYVHIPFCISKCPYCDFYSVSATEELKDRYTDKLIEEISKSKYKKEADTVYFGGGTPSLLGEERLIKIFSAIEKNFSLSKNYEATAEVNPADDLSKFLREIRSAGINRLSIGMQSANNEELRLLGRRHTHENTVTCVKDAVSAGFENYSLDIMLAISKQDFSSLYKTIDECKNLSASHASAYLLKIEEETPYSKIYDTLSLPDDDKAANLYLDACSRLEEHGFKQYEISNFAKPQKESRHNIKYWQGKEYVGFGPAAHSFVNGKRFYFDRNLEEYLKSPVENYDGEGGDLEEYSLLSLRLTNGISLKEIKNRYFEEGEEAFYRMKQNAEKLISTGYVKVSDENISLTREGFLVSNLIFYKIIE